jgi:hypothetical protein
VVCVCEPTTTTTTLTLSCGNVYLLKWCNFLI